MRYVNMLLPRCEWREISELWVVLSISAQPVIVSHIVCLPVHTMLCCLFVCFLFVSQYQPSPWLFLTSFVCPCTPFFVVFCLFFVCFSISAQPVIVSHIVCIACPQTYQIILCLFLQMGTKQTTLCSQPCDCLLHCLFAWGPSSSVSLS